MYENTFCHIGSQVRLRFRFGKSCFSLLFQGRAHSSESTPISLRVSRPGDSASDRALLLPDALNNIFRVSGLFGGYVYLLWFSLAEVLSL